MSSTDEDLMIATGKGDMHSFEQIVFRYQHKAWRIAYHFLGDSAEAEDVAQEAFIKIFEAAPRYSPTAAFQTYFHRVVVSLCIDLSRKKHPISPDSIADIVDNALPVIDGIVNEEQNREIREALYKLPQRQRAAVILRYFEDLSCRDISSAMGATEKSVERLLSRARTSLELLLSHLMKK